MFEGTFRLLKLEAKFFFALVTLAFALLTALVRGIAWLVRKSSQPGRAAQEQVEPPRPLPQSVSPRNAPAQLPSPPAPSPPPVNVNVTVNNTPQVPSPPPPPQPAPSLPGPAQTSTPARPEPVASNRSPSTVLRSPDDGIYLITGNSFIIFHPRASDLLKQLDKMIYIGAHRRGTPFTVPVDLDTSAPLPGTSQISTVVKIDDGMMDVLPRSLPAVDNQVWVARYQRDYERQVSN